MRSLSNRGFFRGVFIRLASRRFEAYITNTAAVRRAALREQNHNVNPLGLYDLDRNIRNVGKAYKQIIQDWRDVLPTQSVCLVAPIVTPSEHGELWADDGEADRIEV